MSSQLKSFHSVILKLWECFGVIRVEGSCNVVAMGKWSVLVGRSSGATSHFVM